MGLLLLGDEHNQATSDLYRVVDVVVRQFMLTARLPLREYVPDAPLWPPPPRAAARCAPVGAGTRVVCPDRALGVALPATELHVIPLGVSVGFNRLAGRAASASAPRGTPASARRYLGSFVGNVVSRVSTVGWSEYARPGRWHLVRAVRARQARASGDTGAAAADRWFVSTTSAFAAVASSGAPTAPGALSIAEYRAVLADSAFVFAPPGTAIETFRVYEALEVGAIPVVCRQAREHGLPLPVDAPLPTVRARGARACQARAALA